MSHPSGVFSLHPSGVPYSHPSGVFGQSSPGRWLYIFYIDIDSPTTTSGFKRIDPITGEDMWTIERNSDPSSILNAAILNVCRQTVETPTVAMPYRSESIANNGTLLLFWSIQIYGFNGLVASDRQYDYGVLGVGEDGNVVFTTKTHEQFAGFNNDLGWGGSGAAWTNTKSIIAIKPRGGNATKASVIDHTTGELGNSLFFGASTDEYDILTTESGLIMAWEILGDARHILPIGIGSTDVIDFSILPTGTSAHIATYPRGFNTVGVSFIDSAESITTALLDLSGVSDGDIVNSQFTNVTEHSYDVLDGLTAILSSSDPGIFNDASKQWYATDEGTDPPTTWLGSTSGTVERFTLYEGQAIARITDNSLIGNARNRLESQGEHTWSIDACRLYRHWVAR